MSMSLQSISPDTRHLADLLLATTVGEMATYAAMSKTLGRDILRYRYLIQSAMKVANSEGGAIFSSVRKQGYRRLPAEDAALIGIHARRRIRHTSRRASKTISRALDTANDMSDAARVRAFQEISALELLRHVALDAARKALKQDSKPQPVAQAMAAMLHQLRGDTAPGGTA